MIKNSTPFEKMRKSDFSNIVILCHLWVLKYLGFVSGLGTAKKGRTFVLPFSFYFLFAYFTSNSLSHFVGLPFTMPCSVTR